MSDRLDQLRQMLDADPDDAFLRYGYAYELEKAGRSDEAIAWYDRTLEADPNHHYAAYRKARVLADDGRDEEACAIARAAGTRAQAAGDAKAAGELFALVDELEP